jgi:Na+/phosphate symporter
MKNKQTKAINLLYFLLWITFIITIFSVISLLLEKRSQKEGFQYSWEQFKSDANKGVNYVVDETKEVANGVGDAVLKPILDSLRSIESGFNSINDGVNNLENEVLSVGERIDSIIRKNTSEITGGEITKGESLQRSTRGNNIFSRINSNINNMIRETSERGKQENERVAKEAQQRTAEVERRVRENIERGKQENERVAKEAQQRMADVEKKMKRLFR